MTKTTLLLALGLTLASFGAEAQQISIGIPAMQGKSIVSTNINELTPVSPMMRRAMTATQKRVAPFKASADYGKTTIILEEDFSLFTAGEDGKPDTTKDLTGFIADFETGTIGQDATFRIPDEYTHTPGWSGQCVYPAGGSVAAYYPGNGGIVNTPNTLNIGGVVHLTCQVKSLSKKQDVLFITPSKGSWLDDTSSMADSNGAFYSIVAKSADGWTNVDVVFELDYYGDDAFFQFNAYNYCDGVQIRNLKIERLDDRAASPRGMGATRFTDDGFTLTWNPQRDADGYLVNVWELVPKGDPVDNTVDFNNMVYDPATKIVSDYKLPQGWSLDLKENAPSVATNPADNTDALLMLFDQDRFDEENWMPSISTPVGGLVEEMTFDVVCVKENTVEDENYGMVLAPEYMISGVTTDGKLTAITMGNTSNEAGGVNHFDIQELTDYYGEVMDISNQYIGYVINIVGAGDAEVVIDNIKFKAAPKLEEVQVVKDARVTENSYAATGMNMAYEHYFTVQATKGSFVSATPKQRTHVFGLKAPKALPATNVDNRGEFTANWEDVKGASAYLVNFYSNFTAPGDVTFTHLDEEFNTGEDFAKYTPEDPCAFAREQFMSLDDFTTVPGWQASGCVVADGMVGCCGDPTTIFYMTTPVMQLGADGGKVTVKLRAISPDAKAKESLRIQFFPGTKVPGDIDFVDGVAEGTVTLEDCGDGYIGFYSSNGCSFFIDKVEISQNLKKGDSCTMFLSQSTVEVPATNLDYSDLKLVDGLDYIYTVQSYKQDMLSREKYLSEESNPIQVGFTNTGIDTIESTEESASEAVYYDLQGRRMMQPVKGFAIRVDAQGRASKVVIR